MTTRVSPQSRDSDYGENSAEEHYSGLARERMGAISCAHRFLKRVLFGELDVTPDLDLDLSPNAALPLLRVTLSTESAQLLMQLFGLVRDSEGAARVLGQAMSANVKVCDVVLGVVI